MKRILSILLVCVLMLSTIFSVNILAASKTALSWKGVKTYATKSIKVYKNTTTTTSSGTIYDGDCITINSYNQSSKRFNVTYPVTTGKNKGATAIGYIKASDIGYNLSNYPSKTWEVALGFEIKGYTRSSKFNKCLTFPEGTTICQFGSNGDYISVVGKVSGAYWLVYMKKVDVRKVPSISTSKTYKITSKLNKNYVLDVANGSKKEDANIQLYKWNGTSAQVFQFEAGSTKSGYRIKSYDSKFYLGGENNNVHLTTAFDCDYYIAEDNDGYIVFKDWLNGKMIDVAGGKVSNGTNIQLYKANNTDSQKFKLVEIVKK